MKDYDKIKSQITSGDIVSSYFLYGEESYFIDQLAKLLEESVVEESLRDFNQTILYGAETDAPTVIDALSRFPMMSDKQLVVIREAKKMKDLVDIAPYFANPNPASVLVIVFKDGKPDKRKSGFKTILSHSTTFESKPLYDSAVPGWIRSFVQQAGYSIDQRSATLLAQYLGTDISKITNEISKLTINLSAGSEITPAAIEKYIGISKDYNVFELQKAMSFRNMDTIFKIIAYFQSNMKSHPIQMLVSSLNSYFSKLLILKTLDTKDSGAIAKSIGVNPYFVKEYIQAGRSFSMQQVCTAFDLLLEYDLKSKGVNSDGESQEGLLEELMIRIMA